MSSGHRQWVEALRASHDHLVDVVGSLSPDEVAGPSYCSEWSTAQVLSHLGSGAEIGVLNLEAALAGTPSPRDRYQGIWDVWNAKSPAAMAADALVSDEVHVATLETLDDVALDSLTLSMMGRELDASAIVAMRLFEHALHTWDIEVMRDPAAEIQAGAAELLVGRVGDRVGRAAKGEKPAKRPVYLQVETSVPSASYGLSIEDEAVALSSEPGADGRLTLPGGALLRLVASRLDEGHTPAALSLSGPVSLDELRGLFVPG
jgi:uncharacterized protein (TIGR03083 family)